MLTTAKVWDISTKDNWASIACKVTMLGHIDSVRCLEVAFTFEFIISTPKNVFAFIHTVTDFVIGDI